MQSLRKGIEEYDRRRGWRGAITNKIKDKNWENKISQYKLDPTLKWDIAEVISVSNDEIRFKIISKNKKNLEGILLSKNLQWTLRQNKSIKERHKIGDVFFVKKDNNS